MNDDRLSTRLHDSAATAPSRTIDLDAVIGRALTVRRRRRVTAVLAAVVLLAAGATSGALAIADDGNKKSTIAPQPLPSQPVPSPPLPSSLSPIPTPAPTSEPAPTPTPTPRSLPPLAIVPAAAAPETLPPGWSTASTLPNAYFMSKAVVGNAIAYWSFDRGDDSKHDYSSAGAVFDVASRTWSLISVSPIAGRFGPAAAGNDHLFFLWGGSEQPPGGEPSGDGATYDLLTKAWRTVAPSPLSAQIPVGATWDGQRFFVVGAKASAAYDPLTDTWTPLPAVPTSPTSPFEASVVQVGDRTYVIGSDSYYLARGAAAWTPIPAPNSGADGFGGNANPSTLTAATDGTTLFAGAITYGGALFVDVFNGTTWTALPPPPVERVNCYPPFVVTPRNVFIACGSSALYDRPTGTWTSYDKPIQVKDVARAVGSSIVFDDNPTLIYTPP